MPRRIHSIHCCDSNPCLVCQPAKLSNYFISQYTDGPATRWNVIDRRTQEWIRRFATEAEANEFAAEMEKRNANSVS